MISLRKLPGNKRVLFFLNGFMLATMIYFYMEDSYEKNLFEVLASYVKNQTPDKANRKEILITCLQVIHSLELSRNEVFDASQFATIKSSLIHPATYDLMTASAACSSNAFILSRLLSELHIKNRIAQMQVRGNFGGHIIIEAETPQGWVVMDPFYNLYFTRPDGNMAGFADVHSNWTYYSKQVPAGYDSAYNYQGVRYTNWQKIPVIMPFLKNVLIFFWGRERTDSMSLRVWVIRKFHFLFLVTAGLYLVLLLLLLRLYLQKPIAALIASFRFIKGFSSP
jgi:hypothetical protein